MPSGTSSTPSNRKVVLVGCGNMGFALLGGWLEAGLKAQNVHVIEPTQTLRERAAALGVTVAADAGSLPADAGIVIFAVKPQILPDILDPYRPLAGRATFVSIAAGITLETLETGLGKEAAIIRAMPNTPAAIGKGSIALCPNGRVGASALAEVSGLLAAGGAVHTVDDEALIDAVTAISGSGPAYLFHFMECLNEAGRRLGLPDDLALALARETVFGAGALAVASSDTPTELRRQVTSPNGTTAAALAVFMEGDALRTLVGAAVTAAYDRSLELSGKEATRVGAG